MLILHNNMIYSVLKNLAIESPHIIACIESLESLFRFLVMTSPALENICPKLCVFNEYQIYIQIKLQLK